MLNRDDYAYLIDMMVSLRDNGPEDETLGICWHVLGEGDTENSKVIRKWLEKQFNEWPKFSGNVKYPVPHCKLAPQMAYNHTYDVYKGEYGNDRMELLDFLIDQAYNEVRHCDR